MLKWRLLLLISSLLSLEICLAAEPIRTPCTVFFIRDAAPNAKGRILIANWVKLISEKGLKKITLIGHASPYNTQEYAIGLGERNARIVQSLLWENGLDAGVTVDSYSHGREEHGEGKGVVGRARVHLDGSSCSAINS